MQTTPYNQQPITIFSKALQQRVFRDIHCIECGWVMGQVVDKTLVVSDSTSDMELIPNTVGFLKTRCSNQRCKQYYHMEFAL
jgi:hypothetical protein